MIELAVLAEHIRTLEALNGKISKANVVNRKRQSWKRDRNNIGGRWFIHQPYKGNESPTKNEHGDILQQVLPEGTG